MAQKLGCHSSSSFWLFEVEEDGAERLLEASDRVLDVLASWHLTIDAAYTDDALPTLTFTLTLILTLTRTLTLTLTLTLTSTVHVLMLVLVWCASRTAACSMVLHRSTKTSAAGTFRASPT